MSDKKVVMFGMTIGSCIGGYVPTLLGADWLSAWSIAGTAFGGLIGIWAGYRLIYS